MNTEKIYIDVAFLFEAVSRNRSRPLSRTVSKQYLKKMNLDNRLCQVVAHKISDDNSFIRAVIVLNSELDTVVIDIEKKFFIDYARFESELAE